MDKSLYYDPQKMLSYNRVLNFIIGARGIGKSYSMKMYPIKRFIKNGEQFIYLRRYKDELKKVSEYFEKVKDEFPDYSFKVKGRQFFIARKDSANEKGNLKWQPFGWAIPLSAWQSEKSSEYPKVTTIIYDEFIRQKDNSNYIPNEVPALLNFMDTVFRDRDNCRCICLSNAVSVVNPYFLYFQLMPNVNKRFNSYDSILIEIPDSKDFSDERRKTRFGRLIADTEYGEMSLNNEFTEDSPLFVEKRSKDTKFVFSIIYKGMTIGVWHDQEAGILFMSNDHDPSTKLCYALSKEDMSDNVMLLTSWKTNFYLKKLVSAFMKGYLRFDNQVLRNIGYEMFQKMHIQ